MNAVSKSLQSDSHSKSQGIILDLNDLSPGHSPNDSLPHQPDSPQINNQHILQNSLITLSQLQHQQEDNPEPPHNTSATEKRTKLEQLRKKREKKVPVTHLIEEQPPITLQKPTNENKDSEPEYSQPKSETSDPKYQPLKEKSSPNPNANLPHIDFDLQNTIDQAEEFGTIYLPEKVIKVHELIITKPIVIIGSTGCTIEVTNSIHVNLIKYPEPDQRVIFLECTFDFEYSGQSQKIPPINQSLSTKRGSKESADRIVSEKRSYSDTINNNLTKYMNGQAPSEMHRTTENPSNTENRIQLFVIYPNTVLDLKDCRITSRNNDTGNTSQDICFYLKSPQTSVLQELINHPNLIVQSTFISNFYTAVQNYMVGRVYLEKIFISNSKDHAINISNPYILEMKECIIENSFKSCVNIRFSKDIESDVERRVLIKNNEFLKGQSYGVSIFGENMVPQACVIVLEENKIAWFQKDAIGIKNLNINAIYLQANDLANNNGNGICAHNVIDTKTFSQIRLGKNKIQHNHLYGITLIDASFYSEHDEITLNGKGGVIISAAEKIKNKKEYTFYKNCPLRTIFNSTKIMNNNDSGVVIVGSLKGPIIFNSCQLSENTNGMYIKQIQGEDFKKPDTNSAALDDSNQLGSIVLERCSVLHNTSSGIYLRNMTNKMYIKATAIYGNKNYAIYIQNQEETDHLVLTQEGKEKVRDYISGFIGGSWGLIHGQNASNACHNTNCSIF